MAATLLPPPEGGGAPPLDSPQAKAAVVNPGGRFLPYQEPFLAAPRAVSRRTQSRFSPHPEPFLAAPKSGVCYSLLLSVVVRFLRWLKGHLSCPTGVLPTTAVSQPPTHTKHRFRRTRKPRLLNFKS